MTDEDPQVRRRLVRYEAHDLALILNPHARKVNRSLIGRLSASLPDGARLDVSTSVEDCRARIKDMIREGRRCLLSGGGDGSFMTVVDAVIDGVRELRAEEPDQEFEQPAVFPLKLGTGNGTAYLLGSTSNPRRDVLALLRPEGVQLHAIQLVRAQGELASWMGIGWDGMVLENYRQVCKRYPRLDGLLGYFVAGFVLTLWQYLRNRTSPQVEVVAHAGKQVAARVGGGIQPFTTDEGEVIYRGPFGIVAVGTLPYYGYGLMAFPLWSRIPGRMHLRVIATSVWELIRRLPALWRGRYAGPNIRDFLLKRFSLRFSEPVAIQINGDGRGLTREIEIEITDEHIELVDLNPAD